MLKHNQTKPNHGFSPDLKGCPDNLEEGYLPRLIQIYINAIILLIVADVTISGPVLADNILTACLPWWEGGYQECQAFSTDGPGGRSHYHHIIIFLSHKGALFQKVTPLVLTQCNWHKFASD